MGLLQGQKVLITGILSERSLAFGIAKFFAEQGAELVITYQSDRFLDRVTKLANRLSCQHVIPMDVAEDSQITTAIEQAADKLQGLDTIIHAIAYAPSDQLNGPFVDVVNREGFRQAHEISSYSFSAIAQASKPYLSESSYASLLTLSYLGAERVVPNYNVMGLAKASLEANVRYLADGLGPCGIRVNAISAGPVQTLAASGISGFKVMLQHQAEIAPLRRNITLEDVASAACFLSSSWASGITGEIIHVDAGYHVIGVSASPSR